MSRKYETFIIISHNMNVAPVKIVKTKILEHCWHCLMDLCYSHQLEQISSVPRDGYTLAPIPGTQGFTAGPYPDNISLHLPVGREEAEAIMQRYPYLFTEPLSARCDDHWFEV